MTACIPKLVIVVLHTTTKTLNPRDMTARILKLIIFSMARVLNDDLIVSKG